MLMRDINTVHQTVRNSIANYKLRLKFVWTTFDIPVLLKTFSERKKKKKESF